MRLPAILSDAARRLARILPESVAGRLLPGPLGYRLSEVPPPITAPDAATRVLIAPANYAGQARLWARALDRLPGVGARNLELVRPGGYGFASDFAVPEHIALRSRRWQRGQLDSLRAYTHVLVEAQRPVVGSLAEGDLEREAELLRSLGLRVGYISHGSDLRSPSLHRSLDEWSPFHEPGWELTPVLERLTERNARFLAQQDHVYVVTPELLLDMPTASWLPNVVDPTVWSNDAEPLSGDRPRVLHMPSGEVMKGSALIDPVCARLHDAGVIEYLRPSRVPPGEMPQLMAASDVVLEQFRLGIYSTTAIEAMAAGRLVVGHVTEQVRTEVRSRTGLDVPIVEATPASLERLLRDIAAQPSTYRDIAAQGPRFVHEVHDGSYSARALQPFLAS